ncbi:MAG: sugar phosphate isomerase/epimerase [Armatimonadetes bacterium]|nr:sugar phosphate isomerase/epimerase [Armatimonadota bacterium]MDW8027766.1 sugar phosphate isomerase/epimerase family protein [Armatimonadota bacterium]
MKLAFSTLGCPNWSLDEIIKNALLWGYQGVELRGLQDEMFLPKHPALTQENRHITKQKFQEVGLQVVALGSSARLGVRKEDWQKQLDEAKAYSELASALHCPVVRVFGGNIPDGMDRETYFKLVAERLQILADFAKPMGVNIAIETHDELVKAADVATILSYVSAENSGCVWDVHHSFRAGETPEQSVKYLGKRIVATHLKDSVRKDGKIRYVPVGQGEVPLVGAIKALRQIGYQGFLTLEWEKRWHPELEEPELVFPEFVTTVQVWLKGLDKDGSREH